MTAPSFPDVLTFGEALLGYGSIDGTLRRAQAFTRFVGGAELNVAVALARLGRRACWASVLGDDAHADAVADAVGAEGTELAIVRATGATAVMFKATGGTSDPEILQLRAGTAFAEHAEAALTAVREIRPRILHVTGIPLGISPAARSATLQLMTLARQNGIPVTFDPNLRVGLWPDLETMRREIDRAAALATTVLPGRNEGALLLGTEDPAEIAEHYLTAGAREVVVKSGAQGADAFTLDGHVHAPPFAVRAVDTVGAGDGFAAGYLDALLDGGDLEERLSRAAAVGALVTTGHGDLAAMPAASDVVALRTGAGR